MKTSFVATVLNEEKDIKEFIDSLLNQSQKPDEIIIVDGGSQDRTKKILKKYKKIKILTKKGNRSTGRNFGISKAKGEIIIVSDAGCIIDKNFIKNIIYPFKYHNTDVVSGYYYPITNSVFERCLSTYTCVMPDRINPNKYLPSSRSIAFHKKVWKQVGGYPEYLDTCEDLVFAKKLKNKRYNFHFKKSAFVRWRQQSNLLKAWKQLYSYAKGDGKAFFIRSQTPILFIRYFIGFVLINLYMGKKNNFILYFILTLLFIYILWAIKKNYKYVRNWKAFYYLPLLQFLSDTAVLIGMTKGLISRVNL